MATRDEMFPSRWLKAADCEPPIVATIERITQETVGQGSNAKRKAILYFHEAVKAHIVNATNFDTMVALTGRENSDDWVGTKIELFAIDVMGPNGPTRGIRIRRPKKVIKKAALPLAPPPSDDIDVAMPTLDADDADDIGF